MLKKALSFAASAVVFLGGLSSFPVQNTAKAEEQPNGCWVLNSVKNYGGGEGSTNFYEAYSEIKDYTYHYHYDTTATMGSYNHETCVGEYLDHVITAEPLKGVYFAGETASVYGTYTFDTNITSDMNHSAVDDVIGLSVTGYFREHPDDEEEIANINISAGNINFKDDKKSRITSGHGNFAQFNVNNSTTLTAEMPKGRETGQKLWIDYNFNNYGAPNIYTVYEYEWVELSALESTTPEPTGKGYWELSGLKNYGGGDAKTTFFRYSSSGKNGVYYYNSNRIVNDTSWKHGSCVGEWMGHTMRATPLKEKYYAGETASSLVSYQFNTNITAAAIKEHGACEGVGLSIAGYYTEHPNDADKVIELCHFSSDLPFADKDGVGITDGALNKDGSYYHENGLAYNENESRTVSAQMPEGRKEDEKLWIDYIFAPYGAPWIVTSYEYTWHEPTTLGDFTGDNIIDGRDATEVLTLYAKNSVSGAAPTADELAKGDVIKDNILDGRDATAILTYYAKSSAGYTGTLQDFVNSQTV